DRGGHDPGGRPGRGRRHQRHPQAGDAGAARPVDPWPETPSGSGLSSEAVANSDDVVDILAGLSLFADLSRPNLEAVAHTFEEEVFPEGQRVIRQGLSG